MVWISCKNMDKWIVKKNQAEKNSNSRPRFHLHYLWLVLIAFYYRNFPAKRNHSPASPKEKKVYRHRPILRISSDLYSMLLPSLLNIRRSLVLVSRCLASVENSIPSKTLESLGFTEKTLSKLRSPDLEPKGKRVFKFNTESPFKINALYVLWFADLFDKAFQRSSITSKRFKRISISLHFFFLCVPTDTNLFFLP